MADDARNKGRSGGPSRGGSSSGGSPARGSSSGRGAPSRSGGGAPRKDGPPRSARPASATTRPSSGPRTERPDEGPALPEGITGAELDAEVQAELRTLSKTNSEVVAKHLVAAALLLDEEPEEAYVHAVYARSRASRVGSVREAVGIAAYATGRYAEALSELRAVRRIHGTVLHLPVMADCQRGLGRPERALEMAGSPEAAQLDPAGQVEMRIVAAGARQDLGQPDAAVLTLECPQLRDMKAPWAPRLRYAYAEALLAAGRSDEGRDWMARALDADTDGTTPAADRLAELEGVTFVELDDSDNSEDSDDTTD